MILRLNLCLLVVLFASSGCHLIAGDEDGAAAAKRRAVLKGVADGSNALALDLYHKLRNRGEAGEGGGNLFFSPFSVSSALAMTWAGARNETEREMAEVLHFTLGQERLHRAYAALCARLDGSGDGFQVSIANALWRQETEKLLADYLALTKRCYGAACREVDFMNATEAARQTINAWVEERTRGKIKDLIKESDINASTMLVLINAIHFKGQWLYRFDKENTIAGPFHVSGTQEVEVPFMVQKTDLKYCETEDLQAVELFYKGKELSMVVLLPREWEGLAGMESRLNTESLKRILGKLRMRRIEIRLPKFKMISDNPLTDIFKALGMKKAFSPREADFSGMTGKRDLFISRILHKAFVEVNEEGTEAAAATAVVMKRTSLPPKPILISVDHPFLFLIKDNTTGAVLFMGRVQNPAAK